VRVIYFNVWWAEIVICEAPVGASIFWPSGLDFLDGEVPGRWKVSKPVGDASEPRCRIVAVGAEVKTKNIRLAIRNAHGKLSKRRQREGVLGVMLKGEPYKVPKIRGALRVVGFFHIPGPDAWEAMYRGILDCKRPKGLPATV